MPMNEDDQSRSQQEPVVGFWKSRTGIALIVFLGIAGLVLSYEHRDHIFSEYGVLVVLLVLCVGVHFFLHGGHGGHGGDGNRDHDSNGGT